MQTTYKLSTGAISPRATLIFAVCAAGFLVCLAAVSGLDRPTWGDEWHFVETVEQFGAELNLETLRTYDEMSTPLPFIIYAAWGNAFGFEIERLRVLSLLIAFATYLLLYLLLVRMLTSVRVVWLGTTFVLLHPYMIGFSIFVFTDMSAIMFMLAACLALVHRRPVWFGCMLAAALLCRQYLGFVFLASLLFFGHQWCMNRRDHSLSMLLATGLSMLPLLSLFYLWGGVHPDNVRQEFYTDEVLGFHASALVLYISLMSLYLLPVLLVCRRLVWRSKRIWLVSLVLSGAYYLYPITPSAAATEANLQTVGLLHRMLPAITESEWLPHALFYLGFLAGLPVLIFILSETCKRLKNKDDNFVLFLDLCVLSFLLVMPFSYLTWEKYFMPVLPLLTVRLLITYGAGAAREGGAPADSKLVR